MSRSITRAWAVTALLGIALSSFACIGGKKQGANREDLESVQASILDAVPDGATKLDISFDNKVILAGYTVSPSAATPGSEVKLTLYWQVKERLDDGWLLFTQVSDEGSGQMLNLDWSGPLRKESGGTQVLGPSKWEVGKVYADVLSVNVPDWGEAMGPDLQVKVGIWKDNARLHVTKGASDGHDAAMPLRLKTNKSKAGRASVPQIEVPHLLPGEAISIDGKADEAAWQHAASTGEFVDVSTGAPNKTFPVNGLVKMLWDDASMYLFFDVVDPDIVGGYQDPTSQPNKFTAAGSPKLWENDTIEIMTDPDGDGDNIDYYEIQINPQNKAFHSQFDRYNAPRGEPNGPFGHEDWDPKLKSSVNLRGTMDNASDRDVGYAVEVQIPWTAFSKAKRLPPTGEDTWRMNFYAMQQNGGVSWSPILGQGNFHKASRFGKVRLVGGKATEAKDAGATLADAGKVTDAGKVSDVSKSNDAGKATMPTIAPVAPPAPPPTIPMRGTVKLPN